MIRQVEQAMRTKPKHFWHEYCRLKASGAQIEIEKSSEWFGDSRRAARPVSNAACHCSRKPACRMMTLVGGGLSKLGFLPSLHYRSIRWLQAHWSVSMWPMP